MVTAGPLAPPVYSSQSEGQMVTAGPLAPPVYSSQSEGEMVTAGPLAPPVYSSQSEGEMVTAGPLAPPVHPSQSEGEMVTAGPMRGYRFFWWVIGNPPTAVCNFFLLVDLPRTLQQFGSAPEIRGIKLLNGV